VSFRVSVRFDILIPSLLVYYVLVPFVIGYVLDVLVGVNRVLL
jgi:hypothetical protein